MTTRSQPARSSDTLRDRRGAGEIERLDPALTLASDLPAALDRGDVLIRFQPQVRIADGRITGAEALARWDHPLLGQVEADQLFAAADRSGLADRLSDHLQQLAFAAVAAWPAELAGLDVSLNVTAGDIARADFAATMLARLAQAGIAPGRLCVEVTEAAPLNDLQAAATALRTLRVAGVRTAIDDVGVGHAGIAWLRALPFDRLKIDKSLIADIATSRHDRALVRGVIALAAALDLHVVAEGVETIAQRDVLLDEGCGGFQGFLCAGALDTAALARLVAESS